MGLSDKVRVAFGRPLPRRRPELLLTGRIPEPMHGLAPRGVMPKKWWSATRDAAYRSTAYHCICCWVWKHVAKGRQWLEAHETYEIDWLLGRMVYLETVPVCHYCHNYIHRGRLEWLLEQGGITHQKYAAIIQHGDRVLREAGIDRATYNLAPPGVIAAWEDWRLVIDGREYPPLYKSHDEYRKAHWR